MQTSSTKKLYIPKYPKLIIDTLKKAGFDAYIVGGCVRDELIGKKPSDYDITTNAKPVDIKKIFKKTIDTGIKHGTVSVIFYDNGKPRVYEVTTYRVDGEYDDARHPKNVVFVDDLKEDLRRRDFTINAMAYNDDKGLVDEFDGRGDLTKKIVRAVGNPYDRFGEDALRILRAVRFAAKLGFDIESETKKAIPFFAKNLSLISKERIQVELTKILTSDNPMYIRLAYDLGLAKYICDGFDRIKLGHVEKNLPVYLAYAALLYNMESDFAYNFLKDLKLDNVTIDRVVALISAKAYYKRILKLSKHQDLTIKYNGLDALIKESIDYLKYDLIYDFIYLLRMNGENLKVITFYEEKVRFFAGRKIPIFIKDLKINGNDLIEIGFIGEEIGAALKNLQKIVHNNYKLNDKKLLQDIAKKAYNIYKSI